MKIYTKTGDDGTTSLFDGSRVDKDDARVNIYGETDELNAVIGLAVSFLKDDEFKQSLYQVQKDLFALGAKLANPENKKQKDKADFGEEKITWLEKQIDQMDAGLESMTSFILPGGTNAAGSLHLARCVCRRAERNLVTFTKAAEMDSTYIEYLNRLSDYLFVAARHANHLAKEGDIKW